MKYAMIMIVGLLSFFSTNSCSIEGEENDETMVNMQINHFKQTAFGVEPQLVLLVKEGDEIEGGEWNYFYDDIDGFEFKPGYLYDIMVSKERIENPPADASSFKYKLEKIISKEAVGSDETFDIRLKWGGHNFVKVTDDHISLMNESRINCGDLCDDLIQQLDTREEISGTFSHGPNSELRFIELQ
ncbi:DUF4377 domain-containing protein [Christiangramia sp.]|uniref:DUF4377 domain-containing protein n=1 Tax=Christiangramia sp. TaxID=1931228 RepID=UPI002625FF61|nr:DUF4377 domain-containing protein [Christiangramia sp.]